MNIVILAGGVGTRLWPLGRKNNPKQFFPLVGKKTLVRETYDRFLAVYGKKKIFFSVTLDLLPPLMKIFPTVPKGQFIVEPSRRDTAPAMGFVATYLMAHYPDEPMAFIPADHFIGHQSLFLKCLKVAEQVINETGQLVDIGITPVFPSTILGYTKIGTLFRKQEGIELYNFAGHKEKPDLETAQSYLLDEHYLWHANYYMWTPRLFLQAFVDYAPTMAATFEKISSLLNSQKRLGKSKQIAIARLYSSLEKISFDYAITEKINPAQLLVMKGTFGWNDVGAWDVLHQQLQSVADEHGNVTKGSTIVFDSTGSLIYGLPKKLVAVVGLKDMVIVDTPDALLVCPKDRAQDVKKLFAIMESKGMKRHL